MIVYFGLCIGAFLFAMIASKCNMKWMVMLSVVILTILAGFRDYSVGTDTKYYHSIFLNFYDGNGIYFKEVAFMYIAKFIMFAFNGDDRAVFLFYAFVTNGLILLALWKMRTFASFSLMAFIYIFYFFPQSMNIMRQYVGLSICLYAMLFLIENKYVKYIVVIIVASFAFHYSLIVALPIGVLWYYINNKNQMMNIATTIILALSFPFVVTPLLSIADGYSSYFSESKFSMSIVYPLELLLFSFYAYLVVSKNTIILKKDDERLDRLLVFNCLISLIMSFFGFFFDQMGRIGLIYSMYKIPCVARMSVNNKYSQLFNCAYIFIILYYIVFRIAINGEIQIFPYSIAR